MRYPSDTVIRMFYKEGLPSISNGKMLELGCGSGNHLMLFASYGWHVTGLDYNPESLKMSAHNLGLMGNKATLIEHDLNISLPSFEAVYDVLLAPSSLYYVSREAATQRLKEINSHLKTGALVYLRMRLPDDHRFGRGAFAGRSAWILNTDYTGEFGLLNVFWTEHELIDVLDETLGIPADSLTILRMTYENVQGSMITRNSDIVMWGRKS